MVAKDVNDYLDKAMYGTPQLKPDEQKKYLGTFRERVVFALTLNQMKNKKFEKYCLDKISKHPQGELLISAKSDEQTQQAFLILAQKANVPFRLIDDAPGNPDPIKTIGVVYTLKTAINLPDIIPAENQFDAKSKETHSTKKTSLFGRLWS